MAHYVDLDGVILSSRHLEAFNVAPLGEARIKTDVTVTDRRSFLAKNDFFKLDSETYDEAHIGPAKYIPGFSFVDMDMVGGSSLWWWASSTPGPTRTRWRGSCNGLLSSETFSAKQVHTPAAQHLQNKCSDDRHHQAPPGVLQTVL